MLENMDRFSISFGNEISSLLRHYDVIEQNLAKALALRRREKRSASKCESRTVSPASFEDIETDPMTPGDNALKRSSIDLLQLDNDIKSLKMQLCDCVKTIVRAFRHNPTAVNVLRGETNERSFEANNFLEFLKLSKEHLY